VRQFRLPLRQIRTGTVPSTFSVTPKTFALPEPFHAEPTAKEKEDQHGQTDIMGPCIDRRESQKGAIFHMHDTNTVNSQK
jgi:hypothetical protein